MPEPTFTGPQKEALEHPVRKAIYDYLVPLGEENPQTLGAIKEVIGEKDIAVVHHQVHRLIRVDLVEKVWGTNHLRVVKR